VVTASLDKTARIWDTASGKELAVLRGHQGMVLSAAFSPDGTRIVTASWDGTARVWDSVSVADRYASTLRPPDPQLMPATRPVN
jgi:WD40 repeat protein